MILGSLNPMDILNKYKRDGKDAFGEFYLYFGDLAYVVREIIKHAPSMLMRDRTNADPIYRLLTDFLNMESYRKYNHDPVYEQAQRALKCLLPIFSQAREMKFSSRNYSQRQRSKARAKDANIKTIKDVIQELEL